MISLKKVFVAAAVATLGFGLFAQTDDYVPTIQSKTNVATQGIFGNDVDNFVDVNSWSEVQPENFFGYFGMDKDGNNENFYKLGFAKQFEKFYWGTYFAGDFGTYNESVLKTDDGTVTIKAKGGEVEINETNPTNPYSFNPGEDTNVTLTNLFGFGNVGLKLDVVLNSGASYSIDAPKYTKKVNADNGGFMFTAGLKEYELGKYRTAPRAFVLYYLNPILDSDPALVWAKIEETDKDTKDYRYDVFGLGAGADIFLAQTEKSEQTATVELTFATLNPKDADLNSAKYVIFPINLGYKATYNATDKLALGFKAELDPTITSVKDKDDADKDVSTFGFSFDPNVAVGLTYNTQKKVILNAGVGFAIPKYEFSKVTGDGYTSTTNNWDGEDASLSFSSGFAINPTQNISIDCSYQIIKDLFGNDTSAELNNNTNFWNSVNKVLVHNIGFEVTVNF